MRRATALALTAALALAGCAGQRGTPVTVKGSDTMVILGQRWAEAYMAARPGAVVQVTGGGSGTGIAALSNGTTDVCQSSRPIKDEENRQLESSEATVRDGGYPISRGLYYYTRRAPQGAVREFIDFALSPEGQKLVTQVGYFPVR